MRLQQERDAEKDVQHHQEMADLIASIKDIQAVPPTVNVQPAPLDQNAVRTEKVQRLAMSMRKSNRVKIFKASGESDINIFLKRFNEELVTLKKMVGINDNLSRQEYVPIFRASLEFSVIERIDQVFMKDPINPKSWGTFDIVDLHKLMKEEFGAKHTYVANVLKQFGPSRLIKSADKKVQDIYYEWSLSIPEIMKPETDQDRKEFVDLIHRSMYYISLDNTGCFKSLWTSLLST